MVLEKNESFSFNFLKDPLNFVRVIYKGKEVY